MEETEIVSLRDGAGLRLQECLELRVKDIDLARRQMVIRINGRRLLAGDPSKRNDTSLATNETRAVDETL